MNIDLRYHTVQAYQNIVKNHLKPNLGYYQLSQLTSLTLHEYMNKVYVEQTFSKTFFKNILKVIKGSLGYATNIVQFIKENPAEKVKLPKYDKKDDDPAHIFTKKEIVMLRWHLL